MPSVLNKKYTLKRDILTGQESKFGIEHHTVSVTQLPTKFDIRTNNPLIPDILNQANLGCCVGNEMSNALKYSIGKASGLTSEWQPSRLYLYYFGRTEDSSPVNQDTGMSLNGCLKGLSKYGVCSEIHWPYTISQFTKRPGKYAIEAGKTHIPEFDYQQVLQNEVHIKQALLTGYPVVIGIQVYESFESDKVAKTGTVPMPDIDTEELLGMHCVAIWAYDDETKLFTLSNSWDKDWGDKGYFTLPYAYVLDPTLCQSLWRTFNKQLLTIHE
jgi:C1A family cysteine protease